MVSPEMAQDKTWWHDERYAIYDLNVNSAAVYPQHEERLDLVSSAGSSYTVKGYAYAGGGRRITRVEISLDKGRCKYHVPHTCSTDSGRLTAFCFIQPGV